MKTLKNPRFSSGRHQNAFRRNRQPGNSISEARNERLQQTVYEVDIPYSAIGLDPRKTDSFRFNLLVNNNDEEVRKSYIAIAPGLGNRLDAENYPTVYLSGIRPEQSD